ncbi:hypothetical protein D3C81_2296080 [compost metagenome]
MGALGHGDALSAEVAHRGDPGGVALLDHDREARFEVVDEVEHLPALGGVVHAEHDDVVLLGLQ